MATRSKAPKTPIPRIRVMLSSRNRDLIPDGNNGAVPLGDVRKELQEVLQRDRLFGHQLLEVWINEQAGAEAGDADVWDHCMEHRGPRPLPEGDPGDGGEGDPQGGRGREAVRGWSHRGSSPIPTSREGQKNYPSPPLAPGP